MADLNTNLNATKHTLALTLRELLKEVPFSKIRVTDICEKCNLNRKSFYYHFKDKYDLVHWIYDTEFFESASQNVYENSYYFLQELCTYLYENRSFYSKVFEGGGQNSFSDYFKEHLYPVMKKRLMETVSEGVVQEFHVRFFTEGMAGAIQNWILEKECISPEQFLTMLKSCARLAASF